MHLGDFVHIYSRAAYNRRGRVVAFGPHSGCVTIDLIGGGKVTVPACDCEIIREVTQ